MLLRLSVLAAALALASPAANGATVTSRGGVTAHVNPAAAGPLQCLVSRLEATGYPVRFMRGYGRGSVRGSLHPAGMALDINQTHRGRTTPRMPSNEITLAASCGVISGAVWRNNDSGHFQVGGWGGHRHKYKRRHRR